MLKYPVLAHKHAEISILGREWIESNPVVLVCFTFRPHSGRLQLAAITRHLDFKAGQKTLRLGLGSQFCLELHLFSQDVCFTVI